MSVGGVIFKKIMLFTSETFRTNIKLWYNRILHKKEKYFKGKQPDISAN